MARKVHILPELPSGPDLGDGGIRQVIRAQIARLPEFGWEHTSNVAEADVIACHIEIPSNYLKLYPEKPFVLQNHGLYWTDYDWGQAWCYDVNKRVLGSLRTADAITAVSDWTAQALRRHSSREVHVAYHGVDLDEWSPSEERGTYVLWNKTRVDVVCDPAPLNDLARLMPEQPFVSTYADESLPNVSVTGTLPYEDSKQFVRRAGVYLCTTRETFGVGTLEALAAGIPVVGWSWGGQNEIIEHGIDGWLVKPGDIDGLVEGIRWARENRDEIAVTARAKAALFSPERAAKVYADIYDSLVEEFTRERPKVSVIVPVYKMGDYLDDTLRSVAEQSLRDIECVIVNDASPDPRDAEIAERWAVADERFRVVTHEENQYLAAARNTGIAASRGQYIFPLDADDQIAPRTLEVLAGALDGDKTMHIAYGNVMFVEADGKTPHIYRMPDGVTPGHSGWPVPFRLDWQLRGPGQLLPYASMYRRKVWESVGGYRRRARSSEDCEFWLRSTSYGFMPQMATTMDTLIYRLREDSMSSPEQEGWEEHRGWFPWVERRDLLPAAASTDMVADAIAVPALDPPFVAVVIPVGPGHQDIVMDAIDSVDAQTFRMWECIVVNDTGEPLPRLPSWVRIVEPEDGRFGGVAAARNAGIASAKTPLFLPLDADDYLQPEALHLMFDAHVERDDRPIVYSDFWQTVEDGGEVTVHHCDDYDPEYITGKRRVFEGEQREGMMHSVTALTPVKVWREIGGYDETLPGWEDWAFAISAGALGYCSRRVEAPLFTYRKHTGFRREENVADFEASRAGMMEKDFGSLKGGKLLACSSCPGGRSTTYGQQMQRNVSAPLAENGEAVKVEYTGNKAGGFSIQGSAMNGSVAPRYRFSAVDRERFVMKDDLHLFEVRSDFRIATETAETLADSAPQLVAARVPSSVAVAEPPAAPPPTPAEPPPMVALSEDETESEPTDSGDTGQRDALMARFSTRPELNDAAREIGLVDPENEATFPTDESLADAIIRLLEMKAEMSTG